MINYSWECFAQVSSSTEKLIFRSRAHLDAFLEADELLEQMEIVSGQQQSVSMSIREEAKGIMDLDAAVDLFKKAREQLAVNLDRFQGEFSSDVSQPTCFIYLFIYAAELI
jgi:hypothetical protein